MGAFDFLEEATIAGLPEGAFDVKELRDWTLNAMLQNSKALNPWAISAGAVAGMTHDLKFFHCDTVGTTETFLNSCGSL